jgi:hypothetical protein
MKSYDEGTKTTVFVLCTADLRREVVEPLIRFVLWASTVEVDEILPIP